MMISNHLSHSITAYILIVVDRIDVLVDLSEVGIFQVHLYPG